MSVEQLATASDVEYLASLIEDSFYEQGYSKRLGGWFSVARNQNSLQVMAVDGQEGEELSIRRYAVSVTELV